MTLWLPIPNLQFVSFSTSQSRIVVQSVSQSWRSIGREKETATDTDHIHLGATEGAGTSVPGDPLSWHLHPRGDRHENRPDRGSSAGKLNARGNYCRPRFRVSTWSGEICLIGFRHVEVLGLSVRHAFQWCNGCIIKHVTAAVTCKSDMCDQGLCSAAPLNGIFGSTSV